jgi:hypothetical protein
MTKSGRERRRLARAKWRWLYSLSHKHLYVFRHNQVATIGPYDGRLYPYHLWQWNGFAWKARVNELECLLCPQCGLLRGNPSHPHRLCL